MATYTQTLTVEAEQLEEQKSVITPSGTMVAYPGQWVINYPDGNVQVMDDDQFQDAFENGEGSPTPMGQGNVSSQGAQIRDNDDDDDDERVTRPEPGRSPGKSPGKRKE